MEEASIEEESLARKVTGIFVALPDAYSVSDDTHRFMMTIMGENPDQIQLEPPKSFFSEEAATLWLKMSPRQGGWIFRMGVVERMTKVEVE